MHTMSSQHTPLQLPTSRTNPQTGLYRRFGPYPHPLSPPSRPRPRPGPRSHHLSCAPSPSHSFTPSLYLTLSPSPYHLSVSRHLSILRLPPLPSLGVSLCLLPPRRFPLIQSILICPSKRTQPLEHRLHERILNPRVKVQLHVANSTVVTTHHQLRPSCGGVILRCFLTPIYSLKDPTHKLRYALAMCRVMLINTSRCSNRGVVGFYVGHQRPANAIYMYMYQRSNCINNEIRKGQRVHCAAWYGNNKSDTPLCVDHTMPQRQENRRKEMHQDEEQGMRP